MRLKYSGYVRYCRSWMVSTYGASRRDRRRTAAVVARSAATSRRKPRCLADDPPRARGSVERGDDRREPAASARCASAKPADDVERRAHSRLAASARPSSWRTRYCSEPPTSPGTHHIRLTATRRRRPSSTATPGRRRRSARRSAPLRLSARATPLADSSARRRDRLGDAAGDVVRVLRLDEHRRAAGGLLGRRAAARDDRHALRHRLEHRQAVPLALARVAEHRPPPRTTRRGPRRARNRGTGRRRRSSIATSPQPSAPATISGSGSSSIGDRRGKPAQVLARLDGADEQQVALRQAV